MSPTVIDLAGQQFGHWVAVSRRMIKSGTGRSLRCEWLCRCSCGSERWIGYSHLVQGRSKMCLDCRREKAALAFFMHEQKTREEEERQAANRIYTGRQYGKWTVIGDGPIWNGTHRHPKWLCRCECGTEREIAANSLRYDTSRGCTACAHGTPYRSDPKTDRTLLTGTMWARIRQGARARLIPFEITREEAFELYLRQKGRCALSGLAISFGDDDNPEVTASLDRIDSALGYCIGNVQWLHKAINLMKSTHNEDQFVALCRAVASHHSETVN